MPRDSDRASGRTIGRRDMLRVLGWTGIAGTTFLLEACRRSDPPADDADASTTAPTGAAEAFEGRLVTLAYDDESLALGVVPVAAGWSFGGTWSPHVEDQLADTMSLGPGYDPNLEAIVAAEPDLILADQYAKREIGDQLRAIGETAFIRFTILGGIDGVREHLLPVGDALGMPVAAQARMAEHVRINEEAAADLAGTEGTVAFVRVREKEFRLVTIDYGYIGPVLYRDLRLTPPPYVVEVNPQDAENRYGWVPMSLEVIPQIDADHVFFLSDHDETLQEMETSPLWKGSRAFEAGQTYQVDNVVWQTTAVLANESKIEDVLTALAP
jgi:iron complex transport system substrate-binding protein